jgi:hypothetical protein
MDTPILPPDTQVKVTLVARPLLTPFAQKLCICEHGVRLYSQTECVFILENYFASKSFVAFREAFSNAYPGNEVPNKTTMH